MTTVLISGASIAGPALAFWLRRAGLDVVVVEKAPAVRGGGYPIDLRGAALDVVERMGLRPAVDAARTGTRRVGFVTERGRRIGGLGADAEHAGAASRAVELPRGDLTRTLWEATRDDVDYVFGDWITALDEDDGGVHVTLAHGDARTVDIVVGADGLHSGVRRLVFGPEERFRRDLDACYAAFSVPNTDDLDREAVVMNTPGRTVALYAVRDQPAVTAVLSYAGPTPVLDHRDTGSQRRLVEHAFGGIGWRVPELLTAMRTAEDFWFDPVSQIRMPAWTRGRVALVGDAACAPSFRSGQGTSVAMVGAYVLAAEIAARPDDAAAALRAYEARTRAFAERNQALAEAGGRLVSPETAGQLRARNVLVRLGPVLSRLGLTTDSGVARAAESITLPPTPVAPDRLAVR